MREYTFRTDGICNTITTVVKDNYVALGMAIRGRYNSDEKIEQTVELNGEEYCNALTTVQKDSLVLMIK